MIGQLMRPSSDQVHIRVDMNKEDMDTFVFCVATKKSALRLAKDMADLVSYSMISENRVQKLFVNVPNH